MPDWLPTLWQVPWLLLVFLLGAAVGSFVNVCVARLPYEKSLIWPGSHCFRCFQPVAWYDNLPLLSYWLLRGRCRRCGAPFSVSYFYVELLTGLAFAGLFHVEVLRNALDLPLLNRQAPLLAWGLVPGRAWVVFVYHALLLTFLLTAALCDLRHLEIPLALTVTGTLVGLVGGMLFAWPFPEQSVRDVPNPLGLPLPPPVLGLQPWPVWYPLPPDWLPQGSPQLGLLTGLAGALAGLLVLRGVRFLFGLGRGVEGLGIGDADLMMMAGAFVGWQPILMAFVVAVFPALVFGLAQIAVRGEQAMPFGPSLAVGVLITLLFWPDLGAHFAPLYFQAVALAVMVVLGAVLLLAASFVLRLRGRPEEDSAGK